MQNAIVEGDAWFKFGCSQYLSSIFSKVNAVHK